MTSDKSDAAKDIAGNIGESIKSKADSTVFKAGGAAREFAARAGSASSDLYARTQDKVHDALDALPDSAAEAVESGRRAYASSSEAVVRRMTKQPIEALLLASAIGYLVGWAVNRS